MHFSGGVKEWMLLVLGVFLLLAALLLPLRLALADGLTAEEERLLNAYQNGELIRIHVIASSDRIADQVIKIKVRNALIDAFGSLLVSAEKHGSDAVFQMLADNVDALQQEAARCAAANGYAGSVCAEVGLLHLPSKQYGSVILPEGEYRALRVTIGEGKGRNWWCVLYPQLCLSLARSTEAPSEALIFSSARIWRHWLVMGN